MPTNKQQLILNYKQFTLNLPKTTKQSKFIKSLSSPAYQYPSHIYVHTNISNVVFSQNYNNKLYCPLVYDRMERLARQRGYCLNTLCVSMYYYQIYMRKMGEKLRNNIYNMDYQGCSAQGEAQSQIFNGFQRQNRQEDVIQACLSISYDVNQCTNLKSRRNKIKTPYSFTSDYNINTNLNQTASSLISLKLKILKTLDWQLNHQTFISLAQQFLTWLKQNIEKQQNHTFLYKKLNDKNIDLQKIAQKQAQIIMQQFLCLEMQQEICAEILLQRIFKEIGVRLQVQGGKLRDLFYTQRKDKGTQKKNIIMITYDQCNINESVYVQSSQSQMVPQYSNILQKANINHMNFGLKKSIFSNLKPNSKINSSLTLHKLQTQSYSHDQKQIKKPPKLQTWRHKITTTRTIKKANNYITSTASTYQSITNHYPSPQLLHLSPSITPFSLSDYQQTNSKTDNSSQLFNFSNSYQNLINFNVKNEQCFCSVSTSARSSCYQRQ